MGVRLGIGTYPLLHQPCFVAALFVLLCTPPICNGLFTYHIYETKQLEALQALLRAWQNTPRFVSVLEGWNVTQRYPCVFKSADDRPSWRGVQCLRSFQNASIVGFLPPEIGNITTQTSLELTGNPQLIGPLPQTLMKTNLFVLDLHDNAFDGEIPFLGNTYEPLFTIDLSGNKFTGLFPHRQIGSMVFLRTLKLARNRFEGPIQEEAFENMTQLVELNLSRNMFNETAKTDNDASLTHCEFE